MFKFNITITLGLLLLLVLLSTHSFKPTTAKWPYSEVTVRIMNWLHSKAMLQVHCKDKHHDIGVKKVAYNKWFEFTLEPSLIWGDTQYFCGFKWNKGPLRYFDIYIQTRDQKSCYKSCDWVVFETGVCMHYPELGAYNKCFGWNNNSLSIASARRRPIVSFPLDGLVNNNTSQPGKGGGAGQVP